MAALTIRPSAIRAYRPCFPRWYAFEQAFPRALITDAPVALSAIMERCTAFDALWVLLRMSTPEADAARRILALWSAHQLLPDFTAHDPCDQRPLRALEAVRDFVVNPSQTNRDIMGEHLGPAIAAGNAARPLSATYAAFGAAAATNADSAQALSMMSCYRCMSQQTRHDRALYYIVRGEYAALDRMNREQEGPCYVG